MAVAAAITMAEVTTPPPAHTALMYFTSTYIFPQVVEVILVLGRQALH